MSSAVDDVLAGARAQGAEGSAGIAKGTLDSLRFDNSFVRSLPADPSSERRVRQVRGACFSRVSPTQVRAPELIGFSAEVAELLGLAPSQLDAAELAEVFSGNRLLSGMEPFAACYGGHQFGNWAGQLGDGRAMTLGETVNARSERWELQLKGAGPTPYSRTADGRAVLRSSLREFLCSEAMFHLGVPTTRALSLVTTGEQVVRDILYDGHPRYEPGAVVCRVAPSFLRFGNFEILAARDEHELMRKLLAYTIATHYPELGDPRAPSSYVALLTEVCRRTAVMIVHWMRVGFVHGVMNTDNMSILGLTIDYGPYGFVEPYDPGFTPNITDASGRRYRFENQPGIAQWNLLRLANALYALFDAPEPLEQALAVYGETLESGLRGMLAQKLGLNSFHVEPHLHGDAVLPPDQELVNELFRVLKLTEIDFTLFYRGLADVAPAAGSSISGASDEELLTPLREAFYQPDSSSSESATAKHELANWVRRYLARVAADGTPHAQRRARMNRVNPRFIFRNYLAQMAIDQAEAEPRTEGPTLVDELLEVLRHPYDEQPGREAFAAKRPEWARNRAGCSMLSCSS
ncbi:MAG: YdiU family protein [Myxococcales bacterium]